MTDNNWNIPSEPVPRCPELERAGYAPLLAAVLASRGIDTPEKAGAFLGRELSSLSDPFELEDMDRAVNRIELAIQRNERITVYGDYDVDGITASCLLYEYLKNRGADCGIYIPDRIGEGYGVNSSALNLLAEQGTKLVVTVDCGVTAVEETEAARKLGMDVIVTDHHRCPSELPKGEAVVDPLRSENGEQSVLAGVGVAFKLVCALERDTEKILDRYSDLVAVGTVADVMPMTGENRVLVSQGIDKLSKAPRPGFAALIREAGAEEKAVTSSVIGYTLAPRINAAGRLCRTEEALKLLLCEDREEASACAVELCGLNRKRQELETVVWRDAMEVLTRNPPTEPIVLAGEDWHSGVVGIAASRLAEEFRLPAIIICMDGDLGKGSCRSYGDFNLFEGLEACSEYLEGFGGHACAAGLNIKRKNIDAFRDALGRYYREHLPSAGSVVKAELLLSGFSLLSMEGVESLDLLEPCGSGNPRPTMCVRDAVLESLTPIGGGKHLRLRFYKAGRSVEGVFFSKTLEELGLAEGQTADVCFSPQINDFRGRKSVQLLISSVRPSRTESLCIRALEGGELPEDCPRIERRDLEVLWRGLKRMGAFPKLKLRHIIEEEEQSPSEPLKLCLGIKIFEELSLLKSTLSGETVSIEFTDSGGKAELESSPLFRCLSRD